MELVNGQVKALNEGKFCVYERSPFIFCTTLPLNEVKMRDRSWVWSSLKHFMKMISTDYNISLCNMQIESLLPQMVFNLIKSWRRQNFDIFEFIRGRTTHNPQRTWTLKCLQKTRYRACDFLKMKILIISNLFVTSFVLLNKPISFGMLFHFSPSHMRRDKFTFLK